MITKEQDKEMQAERLVQLKAQHPDGQHPELRAIGWKGEPESPTEPAKEIDEVRDRVGSLEPLTAKTGKAGTITTGSTTIDSK